MEGKKKVYDSVGERMHLIGVCIKHLIIVDEPRDVYKPNTNKSSV